MKHSAFKLWLSYALAAWFFRHTSRRSIRTRVLTRQNSSTLSPFLTFLKEVAERLKCKSICKRRRCDERSSSVTSSPQLIKCNQTPNRLNMFHSNQNSDADCPAEYQLNRHFKEKHDWSLESSGYVPPLKVATCSQNTKLVPWSQFHIDRTQVLKGHNFKHLFFFKTRLRKWTSR